jgi:excisionase family DNA binding protein
MSAVPQQVTDKPAFLSVEAAAAHTSLSAPTLRKWLAEGRLKAYRPNRRVLIDAGELERLIRGSEGRASA